MKYDLIILQISMSQVKLSQIVALIAGFTVMLVNGSLYVYGTMTPYIVTYLHYKGDSELTISDLSPIITLAVIFTNVGILVSNFPIFTFSNRITGLIAVIGISLSMLILSFCTQFAFYAVIYGVVYGFFIGYGYMAPLKNCYDHLPNRKGLCSGTCLMGFGLGAFFFNFVLTALINPDNAKQDANHLFPEEVGNNLPFALQILAIIYASLGVIGVALTIPIDKDQSEKQALIASEEDELQGNSHFSIFALKFAKERKITSLTFILAATVPFGLFVAFNYKEYGLYFINDDHYLSILGSIGSVGNGLFRMFWGVVMDLMPFKRVKYIIICIFIVSCSTMIWSVKNNASYLLTVLITYGTYGGLYSIYPTQTVRMLGRHLGPKLYYITFLGFSFGAILQFIAHKYLVEQYKIDGYTYCFVIFGAMQLVALILVYTTTLQKEDDKIKDKISTISPQDQN